MDANRFGCFVAERKELIMTQKDLAAKIQVTDKAVSKWERSRRLSLILWREVLRGTTHSERCQHRQIIHDSIFA